MHSFSEKNFDRLQQTAPITRTLAWPPASNRSETLEVVLSMPVHWRVLMRDPHLGVSWILDSELLQFTADARQWRDVATQ